MSMPKCLCVFAAGAEKVSIVGFALRHYDLKLIGLRRLPPIAILYDMQQPGYLCRRPLNERPDSLFRAREISRWLHEFCFQRRKD
jgi:hypothetical protein